MYKVAGEIFVNGQPRNEEHFRQTSAYMLQNDFLFPHLTVLETFDLGK
jgi:ABC-type multidrug transport system ATPase subunit